MCTITLHTNFGNKIKQKYDSARNKSRNKIINIAEKTQTNIDNSLIET